MSKLNLIVWDETLSTKNELLDISHKKFIELAYFLINNILENAPSNSIDDEFSHIINFTKKIFLEEENLQKKFNYPFKDFHQKTHLYFLDQLQKIKSEFILNLDYSKTAFELHQLIFEWYFNHIKKSDKNLAKIIKNHSKFSVNM